MDEKSLAGENQIMNHFHLKEKLELHSLHKFNWFPNIIRIKKQQSLKGKYKTKIRNKDIPETRRKIDDSKEAFASGKNSLNRTTT